MNTTEQYIDMCRKAEEMQDAWIPAVGDWYWYLGSIKIIDIETLDKYITKKLRIERTYLWLPRQDQLQEILFDFKFSIIGRSEKNWKLFRFSLLNQFAFFVKNNTTINSMEQLWLAFVIKEKYDKQWDGTDWK